MYPRFGVPKKIISDRDTRFTSKFAKGLCDSLQICQNISTAYHPQTDGQSERTNQWLEQYLRFWCDEQQDDWNTWLPIAEFAHNQWPNVATRRSPYDLIMGYTPRVEWPKKPNMGRTPSVEAQISELNKLRDNAMQAIVRAQEVTKKGRLGNRNFKPYNKGDQVWIEGTNLKTPYPAKKLGPK